MEVFSCFGSCFVWTRGRVFNSCSQGTRFKSGLARLTLLEDTFVLIVASVNYDFAANFYDLAAKFSRLIFNEIAVIF